MDLMSVLRYVFDHNQQVIGGLMVIILATAAILAMRMVQQEKSASTSGAGKGADLDIGAIEAAFKRVVAAQGGVTVAAGAAAAPSEGVVPTGDAAARDAKIQELAREIDRLTAELSAKSTESGGFGGTTAPPAAGASADAGALEALQAKIAELEGKLTEYEIIEDDIADLSRFKEENAELRSELEALKARTAGGAAATTAAEAPASAPTAEAPAPAAAEPAAEASVPTEAAADPLAALESELAQVNEKAEAAPSPSESAAQAAADLLSAAMAEEAAPPAAQAPAEVAASVPVEPAAPAAPAAAVVNPELDEAALKEFASSVEVQKAPKSEVAESSDLVQAVAAASVADGSSVLDDSVDTEKMLSEVSTLADSNETADDVLTGSLDTDKLLEEVSSLSPAAAPTTSAPTEAASAPAPAPAPAPAAAVAPMPPPESEDSNFEDDLLAEFKESNDGGQG